MEHLTMTTEELRREVRDLWDQKDALNKALRDLPEVPPVDALRAISSAAMNIHYPKVWELGKVLQRKHGLTAVPPKTEYEAAAGLWARIRIGIKIGALGE
jgi:hypothetical protein